MQGNRILFVNGNVTPVSGLPKVAIPSYYFYITDRSKAVLLFWFSVLLVLVSVSVLFLIFCVSR